MKRAAVILLAPFALSIPTVLNAQEDVFNARAAAALRGFGELFRTTCYADLPAPLRIAVAEMRPSPALQESAARFITNRIEAALENEFVVSALRINAELAEALKELRQARPSEQGIQVSGIVTIEPDTDDGKPAVRVTAYSANQECQRTAPLIAVGEIKDPPDDPGAFFKHAAQKLPNKNVERVAVMRPVAGNGISSRTAERLQNLLAAAIRDTFQDRRRSLVSDRPIPPVDLNNDETAVSGTWQARLHLAASPQGIDVRVEFRDPDGHPGSADVTGHFASEYAVAAAAWAAAKDTTSIAALDDFIRQFGDTVYGSMARSRREELRARAAAATPPAATPPAATPPAATPPTETPPAATPPVATPPVATSPVAPPLAAMPPVGTPPAATPPVATPPTEMRAVAPPLRRPPMATQTEQPPVPPPQQPPAIARQTEPEQTPGGDAVRTASAFYRALSQADGAAAAALIVPEKRGRGNFNPAKMTEFYSNMIRRLTVEDIASLDDGVVAVRYSYVSPAKVCNSATATVRTVRRDGRTLIESISARC
jgi:hypothetical protein